MSEYNNHWSSGNNTKNQINKLDEQQIKLKMLKNYKHHLVKNMFQLMKKEIDFGQIINQMNLLKNINKLNNLN